MSDEAPPAAAAAAPEGEVKLSKNEQKRQIKLAKQKAQKAKKAEERVRGWML